MLRVERTIVRKQAVHRYLLLLRRLSPSQARPSQPELFARVLVAASRIWKDRSRGSWEGGSEKETQEKRRVGGRGRGGEVQGGRGAEQWTTEAPIGETRVTELGSWAPAEGNRVLVATRGRGRGVDTYDCLIA